MHKQLSLALRRTTRFTHEEWDAFRIKGLSADHYIKSGDRYFQPAGARTLDAQQGSGGALGRSKYLRYLKDPTRDVDPAALERHRRAAHLLGH